MEFRSLRPQELDAWVAHCCSVFQGPTDTSDYFRNHFLLDPWRDFEGIFVALEQGRIVSTVRVFRREIYLAGERVPVGGIGEVSTLHAYRRKGLSGKLLAMAVDDMNRREVPLSMLFSGANEHYARYGWVTVPRRCVCVPMIEPPPEPFVLRALAERDMPDVMALHERTAARLSGPVARNVAYWRNWMPYAWRCPMVLARGEQIVAYLDVDWDKRARALRIRDWGAVSDGTLMWSAMSQCARQMDVKAHLHLPSALMPGMNSCFVERFDLMWRLNAPIAVRGETIRSPEQLIGAVSNATFFDVDGF